MNYRVLISAPYMQPVLDRFKPYLEQKGVEVVVPPVEERLEEEDLLGWIKGIDGVICGDDRFTERVLREADSLKVISKWGTGIDSIDTQAAARFGIAVRRTENAFSEPVADSVIGYILCFARNLLEMDKAMKSGSWRKTPSVSLRECTLGVIGVGDVGTAVVRRASAFGLRILGHDIRVIDDEKVLASGIEFVDKATLLRESDFVSLNCDLNSTSYHLIGRLELEAMKPTGYLINTARGPLVNEEALVEALLNEEIGGAALDVFEVEPLPQTSPLRTLDNVLLAPHNANSSPAAWDHVHQNTIQNLLDVLKPNGENVA